MRILRCLLLAACLAFPAAAQPAAKKPRLITLDEAIQLALQHNLDLQIVRYNPQASLYELNAAYGGYDPVFSFTGEHDYRVSGGGLDSDNRQIPPSTSDSDVLGASLGGLLPWGLNYNFRFNANDTSGNGFFFDTNINDYVASPFKNTSGAALIDMRQPLLKNFWIDGTRLNIAVAKNRLKYSELTLRQQIINTATAVELAYYDLVSSEENVKVQEKATQLAEQLYKENRKRVEVGVMAPLDEKQAESQAASARANLLSAQRAVEMSQNVLKTLITDNYGELHDVDLVAGENLTAPRQYFNVKESWMLGLTERPDLLQAKLDLERAGVELKYLKNQVYPQLDAFGTYGRSGTSTDYGGVLNNISGGDLPFWVVGGQLTIPLSNVQARNRYKAGKVTVEQAVLSLKRMEQIIMVQIDDGIKSAQAAFERVDATRQARLYAEAALDAEQKKLESGKSTSFFVLQLQRDLTSARSEEIRALTDFNKALATLAQREGSTLVRQKIDVQVK